MRRRWLVRGGPTDAVIGRRWTRSGAELLAANWRDCALRMLGRRADSAWPVRVVRRGDNP